MNSQKEVRPIWVHFTGGKTEFLSQGCIEAELGLYPCFLILESWGGVGWSTAQQVVGWRLRTPTVSSLHQAQSQAGLLLRPHF